MAREGDFRFSYNSDALPADSLVNLSIAGVPVREALDRLLGEGLEYIEEGNYLILRRSLPSLTLEVADIAGRRNAYLVSGYVREALTGEPVADASVYEKELLLATLTDRQGRFRLRVRDRYQTVALTASKILYADTTMFIQLEAVTVSPAGQQGFSDGRRHGGPGDEGDVEKTGLGRFLVSSRQRVQSLNLREFFVESPVQASLTPGLSSQGRLSTQMVNKVSVNLIGGYTAGVEGIEMGGIFNINKKSVRSVQLAGGVNLVGGSARGIQAAGLYNLVLDSLRGAQFGGIHNRVAGDASGFQVGGVFNRVQGNFRGFQLAGAVNKVRGNMRGLQLAVLNKAGNLDGWQVGLVNLADSSSGHSIGLINIIRREGYRRLSLFASESLPLNIAFKSGTSRFYAILKAGISPGREKRYAYGAGIGKEFPAGTRFSIQPEITFAAVDQKHLQGTELLNTWSLDLGFAPAPWIRFFAGPSLNLWYATGRYTSGPDASVYLPASRRNAFSIGSGSLKGWLGWQAGVSVPLF